MPTSVAACVTTSVPRHVLLIFVNRGLACRAGMVRQLEVTPSVLYATYHQVFWASKALPLYMNCSTSSTHGYTCEYNFVEVETRFLHASDGASMMLATTVHKRGKVCCIDRRSDVYLHRLTGNNEPLVITSNRCVIVRPTNSVRFVLNAPSKPKDITDIVHHSAKLPLFSQVEMRQ
ncbi:hypothetical protein K437DRAFT_256935 [Tilletiaria anomala UBC 951]|uniref:Uncharacterized protein n=1 Tax=Tilletiaria anomala (strain ATCC 24038 / CBS 436.72 / UBC 951) TaxID=1037660 RepID=A0A066W1M7_TILAU|nr:uncharacterized protein K437DRAFT_256935 [Tilletiaria anomala UBC 951]KDN44700.1 hypothetical protein K437DRAFT_256935 [Tilletiaria anomala UBC 951]